MSADKSFWDGIPWLIAVVGWACTHLFSEARERRKEVRSQLDKAYEHIQKLEQESRAFHCAAAFEESKALDLTAKIASLERTLARIRIADPNFLNPLIVDLRRSITLDNFEKSTFSPQSAASIILAEISHASQELESGLELRYSRRYPNKFPYFAMPWSHR